MVTVKKGRAKVKLSRRLGVALTTKAARIMVKRPRPPGMRAKAARRRVSDYARQLTEKQKLRAYYNIDERQMLNYFTRARARANSKGINLVDALIQLLEARLDAIVMRGGLAPTVYAARQLVSHRHIQVNGEIVNLPSYQVQVGDVVSVKPESRDMPQVIEALQLSQPAPYLEQQKENFAVRLASLPNHEEVPVQCDLSLVIEHYAR